MTTAWPVPIDAAQANKETPILEMFVATTWASLFGYAQAGTSGLTFGMQGGQMLVDGVLTTVAAQQTVLAASSTNYVEATRAGVVSDNASGFTAGRIPLWIVPTTASGVDLTGLVDCRAWHDRPGIAGRVSVAVTSADVTLSAAQARCDILNITGTLTGNRAVIVPDGPQSWCVTNNTSGAFTLTVKTASGTGIAVTQGKAADLVADGTNVILSNNDAAAIGGALLAANNLSDVANAGTSRTNLGLGTAAVLASDTDGTLTANSDSRVATQKATKTAIAQAIADLVGTAPGVLDTLGEISDAINDDANLYTTLVAALALKAPLASPALTGNPTAPTPSPGDNDTSIATTAFVTAAVAAGGGSHVRNAQTGTSYAVVAGDRGKHVTLSNAASIVATIAQAGTTGFEDGYFFILEVIGAGAVTLTPTTSTINGAATLVLTSRMWAIVTSDGANYRALVVDPAGMLVNAQTGTSYTYLSGDRNKLVTHTNAAAIAGTLPQATGAFGSGWSMCVQNRGAGTLTITPQGGSLIDGAATLVLTTGQGCLIGSDGTDYFTMRGIGGSGGGGSTQGKHSFFVAAGAIAPSISGGCDATTAAATSANRPDIRYLSHDASTIEYHQWFQVMPKSYNGGTITATPCWRHGATTTNFDVIWGLQALFVRNDDAIDAAFGTAQEVTDTGGTTGDFYRGPETSAITPAGTAETNVGIFFRGYRKASDAADNLAIDADLLGWLIHFTTNADTDA